jgi:hypothetical protein
MTKNQIIGAASSVFLIPSFVLTVIPTWATDPGSAVCIALGVIGLPFIPFALRRCDPGNRSILILLGGLLLLYNFSNALDALNGSHAVATGTARNRMTAAKALNEKISELDVRKGQIGPHKIVSEDAAASAQRARDDECHSGQGPVCRSLTASLATIKQDRASTKLDEDFDKAKADLAALGAVEKTVDQTATQLANIAGLIWSPAASSGEAISTHRPIFKAFIVELMNGLMPLVMVMCFGTSPLPEPSKVKDAARAKRYRARQRDAVKAERDASRDASRDAKTAQNGRDVREAGDNVISLPSKKKRKRKQ